MQTDRTNDRENKTQNGYIEKDRQNKRNKGGKKEHNTETDT